MKGSKIKGSNSAVFKIQKAYLCNETRLKGANDSLRRNSQRVEDCDRVKVAKDVNGRML